MLNALGNLYAIVVISVNVLILIGAISLSIYLYKNRLSMRVGLFLAIRSIKRSSKLMTFSIIFVMMFSFFSLLIISGVMSGLIEGSIVTFREKAFGDITVSPLDKKKIIQNSDTIINILKSDDRVAAYSYRYEKGGVVEANWKTQSSNDLPNKRTVQISGINPDLEDATTKLSQNVKEGSYLERGDASKYVLLGKEIVKKYSVVSDVDPTLLRDVEPGAKVRLSIGSSTNEYIVKGIVNIKNQEIGSKVFLVDSELERLGNLTPSDVSLIAIKLKDRDSARDVKASLYSNGLDQYAKIETFEEGTPAFVVNMKNLFGALGNMFGIVGFLVAAITLFIVVFINAITRRKQIGILKGIGINSFAIEFSYVVQAILYALIGCTIGALLAMFIVKPFVDAHPIDFPFSDGILVIETSTTLFRIAALTIVSIIAGYFPARMIVKRNTLDAILGR